MRLAIEATLVAALVLGLLGWLGLAASQWALAILAGQAFAAARFAFALSSNPLHRSYLDSWIEDATALEAEGADISNAAARDLVDLGLHPVMTLRTAESTAPTFDVFQSPNRLVTAAVGRVGGSRSFITQLSDGRLVVTSPHVVAPNEWLVVGFSPGAGRSAPTDAELAADHRHLLEQQIAAGQRPVPSSPRIVGDLFDRENHSYTALGPIVGSFLRLDRRRRLFQLTVAIDPSELLALSWRDGSTGPSRQTPESRNHFESQVREAERPPTLVALQRS